MAEEVQEPQFSEFYYELKSVLDARRYDLKQMLNKLSKFLANDQITIDEYDSLVVIAREQADYNASLPEESKLVQQLMSKVTSLEATVADIESRIAKLEDPEGSEPVLDEYPEYDPHKWYYNGMGCTFEGEKYMCVAPEGQVCTWSPRDYPPYWWKVEENVKEGDGKDA